MMTATDGVILGTLLGGLIIWYLSQKWQTYQKVKVSRRAIKGEKKAVELLEAEGYRILARQLEGTVDLYLDDKLYTRKVKADLLVKKGRKKYIAEIKTGGKANATLPDVRRQMLEYHLIFKPDGMLFVNMEKKEIQVVTFGNLPVKNIFQQKIGTFLMGLITGMVLFTVLYLWLNQGGIT